jgi:endonuclease YncB( thermonuclease family)
MKGPFRISVFLAAALASLVGCGKSDEGGTPEPREKESWLSGAEGLGRRTREAASEHYEKIAPEVLRVIDSARQDGERLAGSVARWTEEQRRRAARILEDVPPRVVTTWSEFERIVEAWSGEASETVKRFTDEDLKPFLSAAGVTVREVSVRVVALADDASLVLARLEDDARDATRHAIDLSALPFGPDTIHAVENNVRGAAVGVVRGLTAWPRLFVFTISLPARFVADRSFGPNLVVRVARSAKGLYVRLTTKPPGRVAQEVGAFLVEAGHSGEISETAAAVVTMAAVTRVITWGLSALPASGEAVEIPVSAVRNVDGDTFSITAAAARMAGLRVARDVQNVPLRLRTIRVPGAASPGRGAEPLGPEANAATGKLLESAATLRLHRPVGFGSQPLEARVEVADPDGTAIDLGEHLLARGLARVNPRRAAHLSPKRLDRYLEIQSKAESAGHGLWAARH